jgi:hypothetical protein
MRTTPWTALLLTSTLALSSAPPGRYVVKAETVFDTQTGLTWQRNGPTSAFTFADAQAYCGSLRLEGRRARLPTLKELKTIVDIGAFHPAIDPVFQGNSDWFWSTTLLAEFSSSHWVIYFNDGSVAALGFATNSVRCVAGRRPGED